MGATYTRQSASAIVDGGVIEASDINAEFNQVLAAFAVTSGHTHDGTAAEGGPITKLLGTAITIGDATAGTDIALTFDGESNDGVLKWMEDEDFYIWERGLIARHRVFDVFRNTLYQLQGMQIPVHLDATSARYGWNVEEAMLKGMKI